MKKIVITLMCAGLLLSSCGSYEATGAYTGSMFGDMIGSAIGGIAGGWRGHEIGSLVGTVGGAAIGAAIGQSADRRQERRVQAARAQRRSEQQRAQAQRQGSQRTPTVVPQQRQESSGYDPQSSGYDPQMGGDDRITFDGAAGTYPAEGAVVAPPVAPDRMAFGHDGAFNGPALIIRNAGIYEDERDGVLTRNESCKVIFEIANNSTRPLYNVFPLVEEVTGNRHVHISPNMRIESIAPHQAVRYTAILKADNRLRNGQIEVRLGVAEGNKVIESQTRQFSVPTAKGRR